MCVQNIGTGRALDMLAGRMEVSTSNVSQSWSQNPFESLTKSSKPLQLVKVHASGDVISLRNDVLLAEQLDDADTIRLANRA